MTDQEVTPPAPPDADPTPAVEPPAQAADLGGAMADEPIPDAAGSTRAREWLTQLEAMIQNVAREAAPVAREVGAKAAELAAVAAVKAGPVAQKAAMATTEYGQRFAERAQSVAADWRHENEVAAASGELPAGAEPPAAPEETGL